MTRRLLPAACTFLILITAACTPSAPALPIESNPAAVSDKVTGSGGSAFLGEITNFEWSDDGRRAGDLLSWIPQAANSSDTQTATRAGATAHAIAAFLADQYKQVKETSTGNPALLQAYAEALIPYLGAMVGDPKGTLAFQPLDSLDSNMPKTAQVFAAMAANNDVRRTFTDAASSRAASYEQQFAEVAAADPNLSGQDPRRGDILRAARLRGLIAAGTRLAGGQPDPTKHSSIYEVQYMIVSRMVRGSDPRISPEFFNQDGSLKSVNEISGGAWSRYNAQLATYLASYPRLGDAISGFQHTVEAIAGS